MTPSYGYYAFLKIANDIALLLQQLNSSMRLVYLTARIITLSIFLFSSVAIVAQSLSRDSLEIQVNEYDRGYNALTTTAYTIPKGALVYQNFNLFINTLEYGITDELSIAGGLVPLDADLDFKPTGLLFLKYNFYKEESISLSVSNLNIIQFNNPDDRFIITPILFVNAAVNTGSNQFLTLGAGYTFAGDGDGFPILTFGYQNRFTKSMALIADLWVPIFGDGFIDTALPIPAVGLRFFAKNDITFDIGFPFIGVKVPLIKPIRKQEVRF